MTSQDIKNLRRYSSKLVDTEARLRREQLENEEAAIARSRRTLLTSPREEQKLSQLRDEERRLSKLDELRDEERRLSRLSKLKDEERRLSQLDELKDEERRLSRLSKLKDEERRLSKLDELKNEERRLSRLSKLEDEERRLSKLQDEERRLSQLQNEERRLSKLQDEERRLSKLQDEERRLSKLQDVERRLSKSSPRRLSRLIQEERLLSPIKNEERRLSQLRNEDERRLSRLEELQLEEDQRRLSQRRLSKLEDEDILLKKSIQLRKSPIKLEKEAIKKSAKETKEILKEEMRSRKSPTRRVIKEEISPAGSIQRIDETIYLLKQKMEYLSGITEDDRVKTLDALHKIDHVILKNVLDKTEHLEKEHEEMVVESLSTVSFERIVLGIRESFMNANYMKCLSKYLQHLINAALSVPNGSEIITSLISGLRIKGAGVDGNASLGHLGHSYGSGVLMVKSNKKANDDLLHEAVVGLYCLNRLRSISPVFVYTYAAIPCSGTYIASNGEVIWCTNKVDNRKYDYVLTEYVEDSRTLSDEIKYGYINGNDYLLIFKQIVAGLEIANEATGFKHDDLHDENVLIQTLNNDVKVFVGEGEYIITRRLARIIDYGRSSFRFLGTTLSPNINDVGNDLGDAYKLLMFSAETAYNNNNLSVFQMIANIYDFFETSVELVDRIVMKMSDPNDYYIYNPRRVDVRRYRDLRLTLNESIEINAEIARGGDLYQRQCNLLDFITTLQTPVLNRDPMLFLLQKEYGIKGKPAADLDAIIFNIRSVFSDPRIYLISLQENYDYIEAAMEDAIIFFKNIKTGWAYYWAAKYVSEIIPEFKTETANYKALLTKYTEEFVVKFERLLIFFDETLDSADFREFIRAF